MKVIFFQTAETQLKKKQVSCLHKFHIETRVWIAKFLMKKHNLSQKCIIWVKSIILNGKSDLKSLN